MLTSGAPFSDNVLAPFREGLKEEGFDASDYVLEMRGADGSSDRLAPLAKELLALDVDVVLAATTGAAQVARALTNSVPIVMLASHDPVEAGVVMSLAAPGGNVTGQSLMGGDLMPKQLEILREIVHVDRLAYLSPDLPEPAPGYASVTDIFERSMRTAAAAAVIELRSFMMRDPSELERVLADLATDDVDALYVVESPFWVVRQPQRPIDQIIEFAKRRRRPSISGPRFYAEQGLLLSYGDARPNSELWRSVTRYVARILRGAKPADMPIDRPTRFELTVNMKTATALGLTLPRTLLDRVATLIH
jgi:putative ABC transport system substrate-binding protein